MVAGHLQPYIGMSLRAGLVYLGPYAVSIQQMIHFIFLLQSKILIKETDVLQDLESFLNIILHELIIDE